MENFKVVTGHTTLNLCLQAKCAAQSIEKLTCGACNGMVQSGSLQQLQLSYSYDTTAIGRMLGLHGKTAIVTAASNALNLLGYQERLLHKRKCAEDKVQLQKITDQSRSKIGELHNAAQKVLSTAYQSSSSAQ